MTDTKSKQVNRIEGLDLLRVLAILCVVFIHTMPSEIQDIGYFNSLSTSSKIFYFGCFAVGRLGVPLFMLFALIERLRPRTDQKILQKKFSLIASDLGNMDFYI